MNSTASPTVLILASGRGQRFLAAGGAGHKLQALLGDKSVMERTIEAVRSAGLPWHLEQSDRHPAMGDSLAAAVQATADAAGWLILPADMPLVLPQTLKAVAAAVKAGASAAHPVFAGRRGHPVGFSARHFVPLADLTGDHGARTLLSRLRSAGQVTDIACEDPGVLLDIDTPQDLDDALALWQARRSACAAPIPSA